MAESNLESLQRILHVTIEKPPNSIFVSCNNQPWNGDSRNSPLYIGNAPFLNSELNNLEENLDRILQVLVKKANKLRINPLHVMSQVYLRSETFKTSCSSNINELLINQGFFYICCPQYYNINIDFESRILILFDFLRTASVKAAKFGFEVLNNIEQNSYDDFLVIVRKLSVFFVNDLHDRTMGNPKSRILSIIILFISNKNIASLLAKEWFDVTIWEKPLMVERNLFFGRLMAVTTLNEYGTAKAENDIWSHNETPSRQVYFASRMTLPALNSSLHSVQMELSHETSVTDEILSTFIKVNPEVRFQILKYFGKILNGNSVKTKFSRQNMASGLEHQSQYLNKMYTFLLVMNGDNSFGFCLNFSWLLLTLSYGIALSKVNKIMSTFCANESEKVSELLCSSDKIVFMGDEEQVTAARVLVENIEIEQDVNRFTNQIYWLTYKAISVLVKPCLDEYITIIRLISEAIGEEEKLKVFSHYCVWRCTIEHTDYIKKLWHYVNLSLSLIIRISLVYSPNGLIDPTDEAAVEFGDGFGRGKAQMLMVKKKFINKSDDDTTDFVMSPQLTLVPADFIGDIIEIIKKMIMIYPSKAFKLGALDILSGLDLELYTCVCIMVMSNSKLFKNIHLRCDGASSSLFYMNMYADEYWKKILNLPVAKEYLVNALMLVFVDTQKAGYYDRINFRLPLVENISSLLKITNYNKSFNNLVSSDNQLFVHLLHLLLNDMSFLIEEVVSLLTEIKRRENNPEAEPAPADSNNTDDDIPMPSQDSDNRTSNFSTLKSRARSTVTYGLKVCKLVGQFCELFKKHILSSQVILPQVVTCLNNCIDHLVGPNCLQLKVKNMTEYNFEPKEWLISIMSCYIHLTSDMDILCKSIASEERYYNHNIFNKALRIARREVMFPSKTLSLFQKMIERVQHYAASASVDIEIPEEFLDPIMQELMSDPVLLPTSNNIMDRAIIERHLMSESTDPFNRMPLSRNDLIPQTELKEKIQQFMKKNNIL